MNTRDITSYAKALKVLKEVAGVQSELDRQEQQARIDNLRKQADADKTKDRTITVVLGNAKDYVG